MKKITSALFIGLCLFASLRFSVDIFDAAEAASHQADLKIQIQTQASAEGIGKETQFNRRPVHTKVKALCVEVAFQDYEPLISFSQLDLISYQSTSQVTPSFFQLRAPPVLI